MVAGLLATDEALVTSDVERVQRLLEEIHQRSGIDFRRYKTPTLARRLARRVVAVGAKNLDSYIEHCLTHPDEYQRLVSSFLIKATEFFRDPPLFEYLRDRVIPALISARRQTGRELRLWSAGCATGEEAYSLAMLVADTLGDELPEWNVRIFATDLDADAVAFARRGVYPAAAVRGLTDDLRDRHLHARRGEFEVSRTVRELVVFGQHDLGERAPFPRCDLVLCRNVLIYFAEEMQVRTLQLLAFALRDDGYLVLGSSEAPDTLPGYFAAEHAPLKVYRRAAERLAIPLTRVRGQERAAGAEPRRQARAGARRRGQPVSPASERWDRVVGDLPVGIVMVDDRNEVVHANAAARRLLALPADHRGRDLASLAPSLPARELHEQIHDARGGDASARVFQLAGADGAPRFIEIAASLGPLEMMGGGLTAMLVVADVSASEAARSTSPRDTDQLARDAQALAARLDQLTETNRQLLRANHDLALLNVELRASVSAASTPNQEVPAATDEVEAMNEELQATNDELETLNEELTATNEDLQEQEGSSDDRDAEGVDPLVIVGADGQPRFRNGAYERELGHDPTAIAAILARAVLGEGFEQVVRLESGKTTRLFEVVGEPLKGDGDQRAAVVTFRERPGPAAASRRS